MLLIDFILKRISSKFMPRKLRVEYPGAMYHVMSRGDRQEDFYLEEVDRRDFLKTLAEACQKTAWQVHATIIKRRTGGSGMDPGGVESPPEK